MMKKNSIIWEESGVEKTDQWGDPDKVSGFLIALIGLIQSEIGEVEIHCAYKKNGHSKNSQHYKGNAADFHFKNLCKESFMEQYNDIIEVLDEFQLTDFTGLGIYPQWNNPGFHIDVRGEKARWGQIDGEYVGADYALEKAEEIL